MTLQMSHYEADPIMAVPKPC